MVITIDLLFWGLGVAFLQQLGKFPWVGSSLTRAVDKYIVCCLSISRAFRLPLTLWQHHR